MRNLRKLQIAADAIFAAAFAVGASDAIAQQAIASRFQPLADSGATIDRQPLSVLNKERVQVVVVMSAPSVAEVRATAPGHQISEQDHEAIHAQVAQQHAALEPTLVSRGGNVLARYHD